METISQHKTHTTHTLCDHIARGECVLHFLPSSHTSHSHTLTYTHTHTSREDCPVCECACRGTLETINMGACANTLALRTQCALGGQAKVLNMIIWRGVQDVCALQIYTLVDCHYILPCRLRADAAVACTCVYMCVRINARAQRTPIRLVHVVGNNDARVSLCVLPVRAYSIIT